MALSNRLHLLFGASRPLSWLIAPAIYFSGFIHSGTYPHTAPALLFALALSFLTCLITFGVNDVYDYNSDIQNPRKNNYWGDGAILNKRDQNFVLSAAKVSTVAVLLISPAAVQFPQLWAYVLLFLFLSWIYSSPPLRLKEWPILDSFSNGMICWLFWLCGYTLSNSVSGEGFLCGWLVIFYASSCHSLAAVADVIPDASANQTTIATVIGVRLTAVFSMISLYAYEKGIRFLDNTNM